VPLVATATRDHVVTASIYSKSVLRVAAGDVALSEPGVVYFPAYEIVTGPQAPDSFFEADRRNVSAAGIACVVAALLAHCAAPSPPIAAPPAEAASIRLSQRVSEAECEEAAADPGIS
jgi:hypothetical protein